MMCGKVLGGAVMDIVVWLRSLGLEQYEAAFRDNAINEKVLLSLTAEDLKDLGVVMVGHRRIMLDAIAALRGDTTAKAPSADAAPRSSAPSVSAEDRAERRQVTVMFSDLVGSTALSARMDPEDLREVISAYQKCVAETVRRFGGFVAKYMGDGVLVYFGYPQAHEDDAERAVRSGLELVTGLTALKSSIPFQIRVGIATGLVVVGDLIGSGEAQERGIVGETPNLAARLQGSAEPNTVVIAEGTRKLLGNLFELEDLGSKDLKGIPGPVRTWLALRASTVESRFEALHASGLTALVGREEETELLLRRWSRAKSGEGQVVLLAGEAGIGKSRLTAALLERLATEAHTHLRYFCSPQHIDSAFYPIIGQMTRAAGLTHEDSAKAKLDKLDVLLAQTSTSIEHAALFAEMLSLPNDGRYPSLDALTPEQRRQRTLEALTSQMETLARQNPVLMIFEDAHWADPTSLEVFSRCVDQIATLRVLLIVTFRPEFEPPWIGRPHVTAVTLNRLAQREVGAIIDRVVGNEPLPARIRQDIIERSDGVPLFIEEMTKAVLEAGTEGAAERTVAAIPSSILAVPATLQASLMARLDRLGSAKDIAQIGAAIGREFSHALLASVARRSETELASELGRLIAAGLLFRQGVPPYARYLFKHALVQDAAYGTLLREPRRVLQARIVETVETQFKEIAENQPELVAHYCNEAGLIDKAIAYFTKAGQQAAVRSAMAEALAQLNKGLDLLVKLPEDRQRCRLELDLQVIFGKTLIAAKGYAAPETGRAYARAQKLWEHLGEAPYPDAVLYGRYVHHLVRGEFEISREASQELLRLAQQSKDSTGELVGHRNLGISLLHLGKFAAASEHMERALYLFTDTQHRFSSFLSVTDLGVSGMAFSAMGLLLLGSLDRAIQRLTEALAEAIKLNRPHTLAHVKSIACRIQTVLRNNAALSDQAQTLVALAKEQSFPYFLGEGFVYQGLALVHNGKSDEGIAMMREGLAVHRSTGSAWLLPHFLGLLGEAHESAGQAETAVTLLTEALSAAEETNERWCEAEIHRLTGQLLLATHTPDQTVAETHLRRAVVVAQEQNAKLWELRAAMSMARLWRDQGKPQQARELLAPVYRWFTQGFDTRDLKDAKALLEELQRP
jgi:predicted ATPase/class 3 adenylate cyclase